ncbi:hypothetical protein M378DRAFT_78897 [Amanita muscaria Koide BX008]|uniref:Uncharacterized protein n=1 Tax=Amanita muscaria (strain Koide BX008) TaxID=946122 RepID=A0A0C2WQN1_AMAMK|nr:hypothetical protein M378DRAFT_78897 [Amanita muscaria Koide BX008]
MAEADQAVADTWKALARTYTITSQSESWEVNRKYLAGITLKLITAVAGSLESGGHLPPRFNEDLEDIVKTALELHRIVSRDVVSMGLVTYTIPCDAEFDPSRMEDINGGGDETGPITQDTVICTVEMGLQCRKKKESGSREEWDAIVKAKVFLASSELNHVPQKTQPSDVLDLTGQIECANELVAGGFWRIYKGRWTEKAMNAVRPPIVVKVISPPPLMERQKNKQFKVSFRNDFLQINDFRFL